MDRLKLDKFLYLIVLLIILFLSFTLSGCSTSVAEGVVIDKKQGDPLLFELGQLKMMDPRRAATEYCVYVQAVNGEVAGFYVSEQEYASISIGSWFVYDRDRHAVAF